MWALGIRTQVFMLVQHALLPCHLPSLSLYYHKQLWVLDERSKGDTHMCLRARTHTHTPRVSFRKPSQVHLSTKKSNAQPAVSGEPCHREKEGGFTPEVQKKEGLAEASLSQNLVGRPSPGGRLGRRLRSTLPWYANWAMNQCHHLQSFCKPLSPASTCKWPVHLWRSA